MDVDVPTALAIQGGAMRSIYCIGAVRALLDSGSLARLSSVHVSSAGCVAGLLLLESGMDESRFADMTEQLLDRVATRRFIDMHRVKRIVDVEYLVDKQLLVGLDTRFGPLVSSHYGSNTEFAFRT